MDPPGGNDVPREWRARSASCRPRCTASGRRDTGWLARLRVDRPEVVQQLREVAVPHALDGTLKGLELLPVAVALEIRHEEQAVLITGPVNALYRSHLNGAIGAAACAA